MAPSKKSEALGFEMTLLAVADEVIAALELAANDIAMKLIALVKAGERNPDILCEEVLKDIGTPKQWAASEAARSSVLPSPTCTRDQD
jgi:hypothetical protein